MQMKLLGITYVDFDVIDQLLIRFSVSASYCSRGGGGYNGTVRQLFIDFKKPVIQLGRKNYSIF
jgi:hypothetical protein